MIDPLSAASAFARYVKNNPRTVVRAAREAVGLRFGVPLAGLRWLASNAAAGPRAPKDLALDAVPPGLRVAATIDAMKTPLRASAIVKIDEVRISDTELRVGIRLLEIKLDVMTDGPSPLGALIKSGALDLSRPGDLVKFLPKPHPALVEADGDRIVLDLMKVPSLAGSRALRRALAFVTPVLGVRAIEVDGDHLYLALSASPARLPEVIAAVVAELR